MMTIPLTPTPPVHLMLVDLLTAGVVKINNNSAIELLIVPHMDLYQEGLFGYTTVEVETIDILWKFFNSDPELGPLFWSLLTNWNGGPSPKMKKAFESKGWRTDGNHSSEWMTDRSLHHFNLLDASKTSAEG